MRTGVHSDRVRGRLSLGNVLTLHSRSGLDEFESRLSNQTHAFCDSESICISNCAFTSPRSLAQPHRPAVQSNQTNACWTHQSECARSVCLPHIVGCSNSQTNRFFFGAAP